jgi:hypothetical protein
MANWIQAHRFIRNRDGASLLEVFLVTAISSIMAIRFFLGLTGYPKLAGGGLHIAHVLVGGLFMLVAMIILLAFLDRWSRNLAAFLGGFGFGAFIDELGKFITSDNNYFFQPTIGLIYIVFILIYLSIQYIIRHGKFSDEEKLVNVLEITKDAVVRDLDAREKQLAMDLLEGSDQSDAVVRSVRDSLNTVQLVPTPEPGFYERIREKASQIYRTMVRNKMFTNVLVAFFIIQSVFYFFDAIDETVGLLNATFWTIGAVLAIAIYRALVSRHSAFLKTFCIIFLLIIIGVIGSSILDMTLPVLSRTQWGLLGFTIVSGSLAVAGTVRLRKSRLAAYRLFRSSILVHIFFVQVFVFFEDQLYGLVGLAGNLITLLVLRYMISQESS